MDNMYLIQEAAEFSSQPPSVVKDDKTSITFIAVLQEADKYNRNGRTYPKEILAEAMQSPSVMERMPKLNFVGEAGHPLQRNDLPEYNASRQRYIDHKNISHFILETWWEGNLLKGKVMTADNAIGRDFANFIRQGMIPAFSLRAQGALDRATGMVGRPLSVISYDWVLTPSNDKAYMEKLCEETKSYMFNLPRYNNNMQMALNESAVLCEEGYTKEMKELPIIDYRHTGSGVRTKSNVFRYQPNSSYQLSEDGAYFIVNDGMSKSLVPEREFLLKQIRYTLAHKL